jgi:putative NIF3 family GTP cyclohydrolase 1 type 2
MGHHHGIDAVARGLAVVDGGHYGLEHVFVDFMEQYLKEQVSSQLTIIKAPVSYPVTSW